MIPENRLREQVVLLQVCSQPRDFTLLKVGEVHHADCTLIKQVEPVVQNR